MITGASSGLGTHFATIAAAAGAAVALVSRRTDRLNALQETICRNGGRAYAVPMDVCEEVSIENALEAIEREFAPIDVLVNNAGIAVTKTFLDTDNNDWNRLVDTNLVGLACVARGAARRMISRGQAGAIINIGSILGVRPGNMAAAYAATKAGVIHLTRGMSLELARYNIRVNALLPGYIATELSDLKDRPAAIERLQRQIPQRRIGEPDDLNGAFILLAADASRYMTGSTITVDGGHPSNSL
ncbi:MAG: SDR family NAD(P)-dependent oxidoreductase [Pseudomonadales bacterium]